MMVAAVNSKYLVAAMRPLGFLTESYLPPLMSGMIATPVSNPLNPRANLGNSSRHVAIVAATVPKDDRSGA